MLRNKLLAYAMHFASFVIENGIEPKAIILFGSVAAQEHDKESDVDIFIDADEADERRIMGALRIFNKTFGEQWKLKGVETPISAVVGNLDAEKWAGLRREMQSHGILVYGAYNAAAEGMGKYLLYRMRFGGISRAKKVSLWRGLYGYAQNVGSKKYEKKGLVAELGGKRLEKGAAIIPLQKSKVFTEFLRKNKIDCLVNELWSDNL